jgi:uncharacterized radical SAM superfamily Fe-S cluster-containing enzyme
MSNIRVGVDTTDHLAFFCPECNAVMFIRDVTTKYMVVNTATGEKDRCTWIECLCPEHGYMGNRKFYWSETDATKADFPYRTKN